MGLLYFAGAQGAVWLLAIAAGLTQYELYTLWKKLDMQPLVYAGSIAGALCILTGHYLPKAPGFDGTLTAFGIATVAFACTTLRNTGADYFKKTLIPTLAGLFMIAFTFSFLANLVSDYVQVNLERTGLLMGVWVIAVAKFADVGALLTGKFFGKTKFAPTISPKKTWEGVVGGLLTSAVVGVALLLIFKNAFPRDFSPLIAVIIAIPVAIAGITSDLIESVFKRMANEKDSGKIIPGIGGVFDLTDSLMLASPVAYALFRLILM